MGSWGVDKSSGVVSSGVLEFMAMIMEGDEKVECRMSNVKEKKMGPKVKTFRQAEAGETQVEVKVKVEVETRSLEIQGRRNIEYRIQNIEYSVNRLMITDY